ncbi:FAD/NAD(P)-binding domain-containing protein [Lophium mytilinum]|uniref:FAD/NAD(P)-binding domain-containing protein n=1 Tax=Lophium mytilinum TaxID=390894 RepID=A0A6A6R266_9PEZI|nr:FAD/NAD(P)-binding domain-containing protein [Lophium mytilinum]
MATMPVTNGVAAQRDEADRLPKVPIHSQRQMRIICIGAGASGLAFAYKLQRSFDDFSLSIYEKNPDISGTWYENRYPGCACDVAAHNYTYSFEPKPDWSSVYAGSEEIYGYFKDFTNKYGLSKYIKTRHEVVGARWDSQTDSWHVQVKDLASGSVSEDTCHILVNAGGILNNWKWPAIKNLDLFKGPKLHSAAWDPSIDLDGKTVGLIGNGSSGIQLLPEILPRVKSMTNFIRTATWVAPPLRGIEQHKYTEEELKDFANKPGHLLEHRKKYQTSTSGVFNLFIKGSETQKLVRATMEKHMKDQLQDPDLESKLIPNWSVGCRRLTPGIKYLESVKKEKVNLVISSVTEFTPTGCKCENGNEYAFDVLVCATGFDVSFRPRFPLLGRDGKNLQDIWKDDSKGYMGVGAPDMPNYFVMLGPNCPIGNGPIMAAIEAQADYILKWCDRWQTENIRSFTPKWEAVEDFVSHSDRYMQSTVWTENCSSWYKGNSVTGRVSALWPGSTLHYLETLAQPRADDYDVVYKGNRFNWLGNGFSQTETDLTSDWAYYIRESDDSEYLSKKKQRQILTKSGSKSGSEFKVI